MKGFTMTTQSYYESTAIVPKDRYLQLQLPQDIPIGSVRVAIVFEKKPSFQAQNQDIKSLLAAMPDVGEDADFSRQQDFGREELE
jgi:hypothetical protein